jgi:uncharacterized membrane protein YqhA
VNELADMPRWKRLPIGLAQLIIMEGNKLALTIMLVIASIGFAVAGVGQIALEAWHLMGLVLFYDGNFEHTAAEGVIGLASLLDQALLAGVVLLVIQGSFQIYVLDPAYNLLTGKPRHSAPALDHLTSGGLKEKAISTIKIASAVYLFKLMLSFGLDQPLSWLYIAALGGFHALFIIGFWVMAKSNQGHK